jgi:hypothetical protein
MLAGCAGWLAALAAGSVLPWSLTPAADRAHHSTRLRGGLAEWRSRGRRRPGFWIQQHGTLRSLLAEQRATTELHPSSQRDTRSRPTTRCANTAHSALPAAPRRLSHRVQWLLEPAGRPHTRCNAIAQIAGRPTGPGRSRARPAPQIARCVDDEQPSIVGTRGALRIAESQLCSPRLSRRSASTATISSSL